MQKPYIAGAILLAALCAGCAKTYPIVTEPKIKIESTGSALRSDSGTEILASELDSIITRNLYNPSQKTSHLVKLNFESNVRYLADRGLFRYFYSFTNESEIPLRLHWSYLEASEFPMESKKLHKLRKPLKPGQSRSSVHESITPPQVLGLPVDIYIKDKSGFDMNVASGQAVAYVPNTVK